MAKIKIDSKLFDRAKEAAEKAKKAGLIVVMDKCIKKEHERLITKGS